MALVIADAGPLIALAKIEQLRVLAQLFGTVTAPEAVWLETQAQTGTDSLRIAEAATEGWLKIETVPVTRRFPLSLHAGECEALQLAHEQANSLLIIDDQLARREAVKMQLNFIGTVKVLALAEQKGLIESATACITAMQAVGYRVSPKFLT